MNFKFHRSLTWIFIFVVVAALAVVVSKSAGEKSSHPHATQQKEIWYCPMHPNYHSDRAGNCPICNMTLVKLESEKASPSMSGKDAANAPKEMTLQEILSMKPGELCLLHHCKHGYCNIKLTEEIIRSGKCPHCGEDLGIILKEAMPQGYTSVKLSPDNEKLIGIKTEAVKKTALVKSIRAVGSIAKDPELYQAEAEYLQAIQAYEKAKTGGIAEIVEQSKQLLESTRIRLATMGLSKELITELEGRKEPDKSLLYAQPDLPVWVYAKVYDYEVPLIKVGEDAEVEIPSVAREALKGKVLAIDPTVDPVTRTTRIRVRIEDPKGMLRPDMYVNVNLQSDLGEVLVVPKDAIFDTGTRQLVFVQKADGKFEPREIKIGAKSDSGAEVKSGLAEGELVVTSGNFLIDSESRLKSALQSMVSESGGEHHHAA